MYYPCSENKDADQLRGYREADLRLCFRPCKLLVFSRTGSFFLFLIQNIDCVYSFETPNRGGSNVYQQPIKSKIFKKILV